MMNPDTEAARYRILAVEREKNRYIVVAQFEGNGPTLRAHFLPYKKMEFFAEGQLIQTDGCY